MNRRWRRMWIGLLIVVLVYGVWLALAWAVQRSLVFPRHLVGLGAMVDPTAAPEAYGGERWWIAISDDEADGRVEAWFLPGEGVSDDEPGPAVIFAHGNAEMIDFLPEQVEPYRQMGISVLLGEYRGYGRSDGTPTEAGLVRDFTRMYDRLAARDDVDADRIIFHGRSIGAAVVAGVATHREPAALILQSPFDRLASMTARYGVPPWFVRDPFDTAAVLRDLDRPVLLQHGRADTIIPYRHSERLHDLAPRSTLIAYDAGHNDMPIFDPDYWHDIQQFLADHDLIDESTAPRIDANSFSREP